MNKIKLLLVVLLSQVPGQAVDASIIHVQYKADILSNLTIGSTTWRNGDDFILNFTYDDATFGTATYNDGLNGIDEDGLGDDNIQASYSFSSYFTIDYTLDEKLESVKPTLSDKDHINWQYAYFSAGGTILDSVQIQSDGLSLNLNRGGGVITLDEVIWSHQIRLDGGNFSFIPTPVPEPSTILLFSAGVVAFASIRLRKKHLRQTTPHEFQGQ